MARKDKQPEHVLGDLKNLSENLGRIRVNYIVSGAHKERDFSKKSMAHTGEAQLKNVSLHNDLEVTLETYEPRDRRADGFVSLRNRKHVYFDRLHPKVLPAVIDTLKLQGYAVYGIYATSINAKQLTTDDERATGKLVKRRRN